MAALHHVVESQDLGLGNRGRAVTPDHNLAIGARERRQKLLGIDRVGAAPAIEEVVAAAEAKGDKGLFNNAAQSWNHAFYWNSLTPTSSEPTGDLAAAIEGSFGSLDRLREELALFESMLTNDASAAAPFWPTEIDPVSASAPRRIPAPSPLLATTGST